MIVLVSGGSSIGGILIARGSGRRMRRDWRIDDVLQVLTTYYECIL